ncbi:hypothetical protein CerSpe_072610 [Prunus speciosa]
MDKRGMAIFSFMFDDDLDDEEHHQTVIQAIVHHTSLRIRAIHEQKLTVVFHMLAWGCSVDAIDEYCRLGESTALESLRKFCCTGEAVYGQWYLRSPNPADLYKLLHKASS